MRSLALFLCLSYLLLTIVASLSDGEGDDFGRGGRKEDGGKGKDGLYYDIYKAIDTMRELTPHQTFYELLDVPPEASDVTISRAFRRKSFLYHPDKLRHTDAGITETSERMSRLLQFVGSLMRSEDGRRSYDWVLHEAPAWHRQTTLVMRRWVPTAKISGKQGAAIFFFLSLAVQLALQWTMYAVNVYIILSSKSAIKAFGEKEVKQMRKKITTSDPVLLSLSNANYYTLLCADRPMPKVPRVTTLWPLALPIALVGWLRGAACRTRGSVNEAGASAAPHHDQSSSPAKSKLA